MTPNGIGPRLVKFRPNHDTEDIRRAAEKLKILRVCSQWHFVAIEYMIDLMLQRFGRQPAPRANKKKGGSR